ncbi:MAG: FeoB-associated Cys-rich membrane protein [Ruminococcus sp.]|nr:FeoB-associated Cys-rich membrane protein [Ruminococcus sp.]
MSFIIDNLGTIIISVVLLAVAASIIFKLVKNKKQGKTSCGCGCSNCPSSSVCHKK